VHPGHDAPGRDYEQEDEHVNFRQSSAPPRWTNYNLVIVGNYRELCFCSVRLWRNILT
jgi:hypothetical protein